MTIALLVSSLPLGATPISSPRSWVVCTMKRVTTLSPPATWSSMSKRAVGKGGGELGGHPFFAFAIGLLVG